MASDSYTVAEAASLLSVSQRRVRQMTAAGRFTVVGEHPTRLAAQAVLDERKRRAVNQIEQAVVPLNDPDQIRVLVTALVSELLPRALEGRDRVEQILQTELAEARAKADQAEQTAAQLRLELDVLRGSKAKKRKGKRRKK
jgi:DNA recombination-dependent growth factor C